MITDAKWISSDYTPNPKKRYPSSYLKRDFKLDSVEGAKLLITCHGLFRAHINGKPVSDTVLDPGPGNYSKRLEYKSFDVSSLLKVGDNSITVTLGDGWYRGCTGIDGFRNLFGDRLSLLCCIEDKNGRVLVKSDSEWLASEDGPIRFGDLEQGEIYDARLEEIGSWHGVTEPAEDMSVLVEYNEAPIKEHEHFAGSLITTPNGERVLDFSQNLAGYTSFKLNAHAGDRLTLWHGETLDENGNFTQSNYDPGDRNNEGGIPQKIEYICREGLNIYKPAFSIFGFRYAKVETDIDLTDAEFEAIAVYSDMEETAKFECSSEAVNKLFKNSVWSMKSNFAGVPTDCPTRERAGWTGDAAAFVNTGLFLMDCGSVYRKWLIECALGQSSSGIVPNIAPPNNPSGVITKIIKGSAGWGDAATIVPMALYRVYGDRTILEDNYPMMKAWVDFLIKRAHKSKLKNLFKANPYKKYTMDTGFHFGEWLEPDIDSTTAMRKNISEGVPALATAYYYLSAKLISEAAEILGKTEDCRKYAKIAEMAGKAWRFTATTDGVINSDRQADYVRPLAFGLLDGAEAEKCAEKLNEMVIANGCRLNTGFLSTPHILKALADYGYTETAYRLLLQDTCPSWLYAVGKGATTIWETWDGVREDGTVHDSLNHYSYGAVCGWLFNGMCGINYSKGKLVIEPHPNPLLQYAEAEWKSPDGTIKSGFKYENGKAVITVRVPEGLQALVKMPDGRSYEAVSGERTFI